MARCTASSVRMGSTGNGRATRLSTSSVTATTGYAQDRVIAGEVFADDPRDLKTTLDPWHAYARRPAVWDENRAA